MSGVVRAIKKVVKAVAKVVSGVVKAIGKVVSAVINFVASPFMSLFGVPDGAQAEADRQEGVLVQTEGSNINVPVVYGYRKVGGTVTYAETGSNDNKYLWVAYVFAEGKVEGLHEVFIDDYQLPGSVVSQMNIEGRQVNVTDSDNKYNGRVVLQFYKGQYYSNPRTSPVGAASLCSAAPSWKTSNVYNGLCVIFARYEWKKQETQEDADNNPFSGSIPKLQISLLGKRVASLLTTSSQFNSGLGGYEDGMVSYEGTGYQERYSSNPAEHLLDYLRNPRFGKGMKNAEIDIDSFQKAAAKCNQQVTYVTGITGPIMTNHYVLDTGQTLFNNTRILLSNFRAYLPYVQGKYKLKIEDAGNETDITSGVATIVKTLNKDNIVGDITYTGIERGSKYNHVTVNYVDPDQKFSVQQVVFPEEESVRQNFIALDGNRENKTEVTMSGCTNYAMAKDFARLIFNKSRYQDSCSLTADSSALELEPGDNIYIDSTILSFGTDPNAGAIPWRIVSWKLNNDHTVELGCVRNPDFIYPHTRVGEIDIVIPPYIPKGAQIEYPGPGREFPIGLVPPTTSTSGDGSDQTDPNDTNEGGGNGDPNDTSDNGGTNDNTNDDPPDPPSTTPLDDFCEIIRVDYETAGAPGQVYADITIRQPDNPQYAALHFYYKFQSSSITNWTLHEIVDLPGPGQEIQFKIGPLYKGQTYKTVSRVKYEDGDFSTVVNRAKLERVGENVTEDPVDYQEFVLAGWDLPTEEPVNNRDTYINGIRGSMVLDGSSNPSSPRTIRVILSQDVNNVAFNPFVKGVNVYYKSSINQYWRTYQEVFDSTYVPGGEYTFDLALFGVPSTYQFYDIVIRFFYDDGTESNVQYRAMGIRTETDPFTLNQFNPFALVIARFREGVEDFVLVTEENAPPGSVTDPLDIEIAFTSIARNDTTPTGSGIRFFISTPPNRDLLYLLGVRIIKNHISLDGTQTQTTTDIKPIPVSNATYSFSIDTIYDMMTEYVIVPLVESNGETTATNAWYLSGIIHNRTQADDYPQATGNWLQKFNYELLTYTAAQAKLGTATSAGVRRDTQFDDIDGQTLLTGGVPRTPREMSITFTQDISTATYGINGNIAGIRTYYKQSGDTYWSYDDIPLTSYVEGDSTTVTLPFGLGAPTYPSVPGTQDNYDFIFRFYYTDGTESLQQYRVMAANVEYSPFGDYDFDPFLGRTETKENVTSYPFLTVDEAPEGAVTNPTDIKTPPRFVTFSGQSANQLRVFIQKPDASDIADFVGIRLRQKKVLKTATSTTQTDYTPVDINPTTFDYSFLINPVDYDINYEWVITPLVLSGGSTVEADNSVYMAGAVHFRQSDEDYPPDHNWLRSLHVEAGATSDMINLIGTLEPAKPLRNTKFDSVQFIESTSGGSPTTPRSGVLRIEQTAATTGNNRLKGVKVFYKYGLDKYYEYFIHEFSGYVEGSSYDIPVTNLGAPIDPATNQFARLTTYNFGLRWIYDNDEEGQFEARGGGSVQNGTFSFTTTQADVESSPIITVDNAPPGAIQDPRDIVLAIDQDSFVSNPIATVANGQQSASWYFWINETELNARLLGARLYIRPVIAGTDPDFQTFDYMPLPTAVQKTRLIMTHAMEWDKEYQIVIVPLVTYNLATVEAKQAWFAQGYIHDRLVYDNPKYPSGIIPNWFERLNCKLITTAEAKNELNTEFPKAEATVNVLQWKLYSNKTGTINSLRYKYPQHSWRELTYDTSHIDNYTSTVIYRRTRWLNRTDYDDGRYPKYWGLSQWEKLEEGVDFTPTTNADGSKTVKLRSPLGFRTFSSRKFGVSGGASYFDNARDDAYTKYVASPTDDYILPLNISAEGTEEYFLVPKISGTESANGTLLPNPIKGPINTDYSPHDVLKNYKSGIVIQPVANYNQLDTGFLRRLDEAQDVHPDSLLTTGTVFALTTTGNYTDPSSGVV